MIELKTENEIKRIKESCRITAYVLNRLKEMVKPGMPSIELDSEARRLVAERKAKPAFLGYRGYPAAVCVSINSEVVHGIPSKERVFKEGDIVSIDFGVEYGGFYGDSAVTVAAGRISPEAVKLMDVTRECLERGIEKAVHGNRLYDISAAIQQNAEENGFSVVRDFVGHGIGRQMHEEPMIPNYGNPGTGAELKNGMVFAIEPMVNAKGFEVVVLEDDWTVVTQDRSLSAHYEHVVAVTKNGPIILTKE
ncbi:MAG TPA: type I methionyl aminopeptidase [bacterium]|nr:type I methionyl aminopeptidase [bacterium]